MGRGSCTEEVIDIRVGDCRELLRAMPAESVQCVVTSPPYWGLRSYTGGEGMIGLEPTFEEHLANLVEVFREARRVLRPDGVCWLNYGDAYASDQKGTGGAMKKQASNAGSFIDGGFKLNHGLKPKDLMMMPARVALALQADGVADAKAMQVIDRVRRELIDAYDDAPIPDKALVVLERLDAEYAEAKGDSWWVRSKIIWNKKNPMPESVTDRPTSSYEELFLLTKSARYFYDGDAVRVPYNPKSLSRYDSPMQNNEPTGRQPGVPRFRSEEQNIRDPNPSGANLRNVWTVPTHSFSGWIETVDLVQLSASQVQELDASDSEADGDTARIASPDCPLHADHPDLVPTGFYDGLEDDQVRRMHGNNSHLVPAQVNDSGATETTLDPSPSRPSIGDCSDHADSLSATERNSGSHKTGHGPVSSAHAKSSSENASHIERTGQEQLETSATSHDIDENRSEGDMPPSHSKQQMAESSVRKSTLGSSSGSCLCAYYRKVVGKTSHFATFPPKLVEPCILAGTSAKGCCAECGAPLVRVVEREDSSNVRRNAIAPLSINGWLSRAGDPRTTTKAWRPSCECGGNTKPCVVLDPFAGAGTVGLVAQRLGRDAILIELSPKYAEMARDRIVADAPLFSDVTIKEDDR